MSKHDTDDIWMDVSVRALFLAICGLLSFVVYVFSQKSQINSSISETKERVTRLLN